MKYIKKFEELNLGTYANYMDKTESYPWTGFLGNKEKSDKMNRINNSARKRFTDEFFKLYPKKDTKIIFTDKQAEYELYLYDIKFNTNYTNYDLIFKTEGMQYVFINNPLYITNSDLSKISLFPVKLAEESKLLINKMFNYGLSGEKIQ